MAGEEYATLRLLRAAGLDVPEPIAYEERVILMEYIGDEAAAAPPLHTVDLEPDDARAVFERLRWNIGAMLECHRVHGDLSPYNILYRDGRVWIIDFPQAVDPRENRSAERLLVRDVENLCRYFVNYGVPADPDRIAGDLWRRYQRARLYSYR